jgi:hypothetical protein
MQIATRVDWHGMLIVATARSGRHVGSYEWLMLGAAGARARVVTKVYGNQGTIRNDIRVMRAYGESRVTGTGVVLRFWYGS